jgi:hypothetical protein
MSQEWTKDIFFSETTVNAFDSYSTFVGDNVNSQFTVVHNLCSQDVVVTVREVGSNLIAYPAIEITSLSSVTVGFNFIPGLTAYDVTVFASASAKKITGFEDRITVNVTQPVQDISVDVTTPQTNIVVGSEQDVTTVITNTEITTTDVNVGVVDSTENISVTVLGNNGGWGLITGTLSAQTDLWTYLQSITGGGGGSGSQTLSYNTATALLSISNGNSVSLSSLSSVGFSVPQLTAYLASNCLTLSCIDVRGRILSGGRDLADIFLTTETDAQTLTYTPSSYLLSISNGNTVSLSSINTTLNATSALLTPLILTNTLTGQLVTNTAFNSYQTNVASSTALLTPLNLTNTLTGQLVTNTAFNSYQTKVANTTATLLPTSIYQNASANWQSTFLTVSALSASWEESADILPTVTNYLSTNNVQISALTITNTLSSINSLTISGNISGNNLRTSFNQGSAIGDYSFAVNTGRAFAQNTFACGSNSFAQAAGAFASGISTLASGLASHSEGNGTIASNQCSHAEGLSTTASGEASHAEGSFTTASNTGSHAEGRLTKASGYGSHAEGSETIASGIYSHSAGVRATAALDYSYAWCDGLLNTASVNAATTRTGQYMVSASGGVFIPGRVGIGTDSTANALTVVGNISATGVVYASGGNSNLWNNSKTITYFTATQNQPPSGSFATLDTRNSIAVLDFDDTAVESAIFLGIIPEGTILTSGLAVYTTWMATSATTGNVVWRAEWMDCNTDLNANSFALPVSAIGTANGTSGITTTTLLSTTNIDGLAAGDMFRLRISRVGSDGTNDTMSGDAELVAVEVRTV